MNMQMILQKFLSKKRSPVPLIIGLGLLVASIMGYSLLMGTSMSQRYLPLVDVVTEIKFEATLAHLWFEEINSGDQHIDIAKIYSQIQRSKQLAEAMLVGGENSKSMFVPLDDPNMHQQVYGVLILIDEFLQLVKERLEQRPQSGVGSALDKNFDAKFKKLLIRTDRIGDALQWAIKLDLQRFQIIQGLLILFCLGVSVTIALLFWGYERRQARDIANIKKSENNLSITLNSIGDGVIVTDAQERITRINPIAATLTGWSAEQARGELLGDVFNIVNSKTREKVEGPAAKVLASGSIVGLANHTSLITKDGNEYQIADSGAPIIDESGEITGVVIVFRDVTQSYYREQKLHESESRYRSLVEYMFSGVAVYDGVDGGEDFIIRDINRVGEQINNTKNADVIGRRVTEAFPGVKEFGLFEVLQRVYRTGQPESHPVSMYQDSKMVIWLENQVYKLPSGEVVAIYDDVTKRKNAELELLNARDVAFAASQAKSEFLAVMSHEIRTPLNAILGMTEVSREAELTEDQKHCLGVIDRAGNNLLTLIEDILDLSHVESGKMVVAKRAVALHKLLQDAVEIHAQNAASKGLVLDYKIDGAVPQKFTGDQKRLRQVLLNLLGNAVKFTEQGKVELRLMLQDPQTLIFSVTDSGIGISKQQQNIIFEPFQQVDTSSTRKYGGVGLGLSLCKRLLTAMGGKIWLESAPDLGSTFYFSLPMEMVADSEQQELSASKRNNADNIVVTEVGEPTERSILLVEDDSDNAMLIKAFLKKTPHQLDLVGDGCQAVARFKSQTKYDLVLMDIQMPCMDGLEATRQIRTWEQKKGAVATPILALTAHAMSEDAEKSLEAGCDLHLTKPITKKKLLAVIEEFTGK